MTAPIDVRIIGNLLPPDWWTIGLTALATIIGALIGAVIAYVVARQTATENRTTQKIVRRDAEESATLRAVVKVMELTDSLGGYYMIIERTIEQGRKQIGREDAATWLVMRSMTGKPKEISITADDLIAFTRAREFGYITELLFLFNRYNSMIYGVAEYGARRDQLLSMITPQTMNGIVGSIVLDQDEFRELLPHIAAVNDLAEQTRREVKEVYDSALEIVPRFGPIVRKYFDDPKFPYPGIVSPVSKTETPTQLQS